MRIAVALILRFPVKAQSIDDFSESASLAPGGPGVSTRKPRMSAALQALIEAHRHQPGALLPLLHAVQEQFGHVPASAVPEIAAALNLSRAEVHGVVTYYHHFRSAVPGRNVIQVCRAEACQACGGDALMAHAEQILGCKGHETRADGAVTLEPVYCLGLCAQSPAIVVNDRLHARVTPQRLEQLVSQLEGV
jgi:formate dehydrogenase subunit gamma